MLSFFSELPDSTPVISGSDPRKSLKAGDILNLTCTSKPSNPAAQLEWSLNGKSVESNSPQKQIDVGRGLVSTKTDLYMRYGLNYPILQKKFVKCKNLCTVQGHRQL